MPLTSLNRIVGILIVGSIPVIWYFFRVPNAVSIVKPAESAGSVIVGFEILASTMIIGLLIDSVTELFTRILVNKAKKSRQIARIFFQRPTYDTFVHWMGLFRVALHNSTFNLPAVEGHRTSLENFDVTRAAAIGIFFKEAKKENFDWMVTNDATYSLSLNLATSTIVLWILELFAGRSGWIYPALFLPVFYVFITRAVNRDLYTDFLILRFSTLYCLEHPADNSFRTTAT
jgi:hypothetical protein